MKRLSDRCFLLAVLLFLFAVPALVLVHGSRVRSSVYENRAMAALPAADPDALLSGATFSGWDTWLTDHIAGRDRLLRLNAWMDYRVLGRPVVNDIVVDSDVLLTFQPYGGHDLSYLPASAGAACDGLSALDGAVSAYGGRLYYLGLPLQHSYFSARYPAYLESRQDQLQATAAAFFGEMERRGLAYVDMAAVYDAMGHPDAFYTRSDHHFTYAGAFAAYRTLMGRINADTGLGLPVLAQEDLEFQTLALPFLGSRNRKLCGLWTGEEALTIGVQRDPVPFTREDNGAEVPSALYATPWEGAAFVDYNVYMGGDVAETVLRTERPELPDLLIFGDSFTNPLETLLYTGFDETRSLDLRYYDEMGILEYVETYRPDVVVCIRDNTSYLLRTGNGDIH